MFKCVKSMPTDGHSPRDGSYIPALRFDFLTPLYDTLIRLTLREDEFKRRLLDQAAIEPSHAVLDVGCGTGTLVVMAKHAYPTARIAGVDGDATILAIAREKCLAAGAEVSLRNGSAVGLPFPSQSFDRVLSSLVFHHLTTADKNRALAEVFRVLRPSGSIHIADWGKPQNALMALASLGIRLLDGDEVTRANLDGELPAFLEDAGFTSVTEIDRWMTPYGTLSFYSGTRPT